MESSQVTQSPQHSDAAPTRNILRLALALYVVFLTWALLSPDPWALFRTREPGPKKPWPPYLAWLANDKVHHATAYGILTALLLGATPWPPAAALAAAAAHGGAMEILQQWFPPRSMELMDWIADLSGAFGVLLIYRLLPRRRSD